ncbi:type III-B CRISPR module RAMP protein Cmr1 [Clostridium oceanicum]|uniref:CRISPR type III-associated protein domain-containing protein n=1 Tax=Clostridium oceanicum TaxID=1543 RepID=A0ABP3UVB5_9CLOT
MAGDINSHFGVFLDKIVPLNKYKEGKINDNSWIHKSNVSLLEKERKIVSFLKGDKNSENEKDDLNIKLNEDFIKKVYKDEQDKLASISKKISTINLRVSQKIIVGFGESTIENFSLCIHHFYGIPYIPASTIKGCIFNYLNFKLDKDNSNNNLNCIKDKFYEIMFFDSFGKGYNISEDILTNISPSYYEKGELKNKDEECLPVFFLALEGGQFTFNYYINNGIEEENIKIEIENLIKEALCVFGLGGRTNVGYGHFKEKVTKKITGQHIYKINKKIFEKKGAKKEKNEKGEILREVRLTSIKGLMRKWWRSLFAYEVGNKIRNTKDLFKEENLLFGDKEDQASPFGLRIVNEDNNDVFIEVYMNRKDTDKDIEYYKALFEATLFLEKGYVTQNNTFVDNILDKIIFDKKIFKSKKEVIEYEVNGKKIKKSKEKQKLFNFKIEKETFSRVKWVKKMQDCNLKQLSRKRIEDKKYVYFKKNKHGKKGSETEFIEVEFNFLPKRKEEK